MRAYRRRKGAEAAADVLDEAVIERVLDCRPSRTRPEEVLVKHKGGMRGGYLLFIVHHEKYACECVFANDLLCSTRCEYSCACFL